MKKPRKKGRLPSRLPLPKKPGHPIGTARGEKGYDRKREREEIERDIESEEEGEE